MLTSENFSLSVSCLTSSISKFLTEFVREIPLVFSQGVVHGFGGYIINFPLDSLTILVFVFAKS